MHQLKWGAKILKELTQLVATHGEETPDLRLQAYVRARGFETGCRVRSYGELVTPDMVPWVQQTQPISSRRRSRRGRDYACLQSQFLELQEKHERQQKAMEELRQMVLSSQHQSSRSHSKQSPSQQRSPYQPPLYQPMPCPHGEFTSMLNEPDLFFFKYFF